MADGPRGRRRQHAPHNALEDAAEIARFHDRCSPLMRALLDALAAAPDHPRPFPEIEDALGWHRRRIASVLGGVAHLRLMEFAGRRPYRFHDVAESRSGRWEIWMDAGQAERCAPPRRSAATRTESPAMVTGGCLCGAVRYEVRGPLPRRADLSLRRVPALARARRRVHCGPARGPGAARPARPALDRQPAQRRRRPARVLCRVRLQPVLGSAGARDDQHRRRDARRAHGAARDRPLVRGPGR